MAWHDELRHLDEERTAGRLTEDEYRRHRDELIAQIEAKPGNGVAEDNAAGQNSPFPPAFRWEGEAPETTEVIQLTSREDTDDSADQTQIVRNAGQPQQGPSYDADQTQVVQAGLVPPAFYGQSPYQQQHPGQQYPDQQHLDQQHPDQQYPDQQYPDQRHPGGGFPPPPEQPPAWTQQGSGPPWGSADLPIQEPNAGWMMQDSTFFPPAEEGRESRTMRIVAVAAVIAVLIAIAFSAGFLWGRGTSCSPVEPASVTLRDVG